MKKRLMTIPAILAAIPLQVQAHGLSQAGPDWCAPINPQPSITHETAKNGNFPGPYDHYLMDRVDLIEIPIDNIPEFHNRDMRARFWALQPGGVIKDHCHDNRPAMVYLLTGRVIETKMVNDIPTVGTLVAGQAIAEGNGTRHWWRNEGEEAVFMFAIDLPVKPEQKLPQRRSEGVAVEDDLAQLDFEKEYPHILAIKDYAVTTRRVTVQPNGFIGLDQITGNPAIAYVTRGSFLERRSDAEDPIVRLKNHHTSWKNGVVSIWENIGNSTSEIVVIELRKKGQ